MKERSAISDQRSAGRSSRVACYLLEAQATCWTIVLLLPMTAAAAIEVPLMIGETAGVPRERAPVACGIPLPRGEFGRDASFALFDGDRETPLQVTPLVVEKNGTLRWILLDFQVSIAARETKTLRLRAAAPAARSDPALRIEESPEAVTVDTGALRFAVSKMKPFALFDGVTARGRQVLDGGALDLVEGKSGRRFVAGKPRSVAVEYGGPIRATIRVDGEYVPEDPAAPQAGYVAGYTTRITAWAGSAVLRIDHVLANSNREQVAHLNVRTASIRLRHALGAGAEPLPGDGDGLADVRSGDGAVRIIDRDFLGDPPRRVAAEGGQLVAEYVSVKPAGAKEPPFRSDCLWLYDLSHRAAEIWIDLDAGRAAPGASSGGAAPDPLAAAARSRLIAFAPPDWYARSDAFGVGRFGTLEDEKAAYRAWGWRFDENKVPRRDPDPVVFVRWEDNHYESEADSVEGLLLMAVRSGSRGFFDQAEAWARYHASLHAWRTDGWTYDDGAIWFPQGGPLGTVPSRKPPAWKYQHWDKGTGDDRELWHLVQGKSCYCHFYGAGLVDHYLLTGSRDSLEAAVDLVEQKDSELRKHRKLAPGKTTIDDTRGFGRGFYVIVRVLEALPGDRRTEDLARLCADVLRRAPDLDERGFAPCHIGTGFGGFDPKRDIPPEMAAFMEREGIRMDAKGWLEDRGGRRWPAVCLGGTWQHAYVAAAADRWAHLTGDEDLGDFAEAFGRFAARHLLSAKCRQVPYYAYMDVPVKGEAWDPWKFQAAHVATKDGVGCEHEGWYTRFFPDSIVAAYERSGDLRLLDRAREFWNQGSKRGYHTKTYSAGPDEVGEFANHHPPKDDSVLSTARLFDCWSHPRTDREPPETVGDLTVEATGGGRARVRFTAPQDRGGGRVAGYQIKCAALPIVEYDAYDHGRDDCAKRNFWRAANLTGEPAPGTPGSREEFEASGVPEAPASGRLWFVVASRDEAGNRSALSNLAEAAAGK